MSAITLGLPDYCYTYSPCINTDLAYKDPYGNGGFGKSIEVYEKGEKENLHTVLSVCKNTSIECATLYWNRVSATIK